MGILRRPKEDMEYEWKRRNVNKQLAQALCDLKIEYLKNDDIGVSFLDLDTELTGDKFARDLVHLNGSGARDLGKSMMERFLASEIAYKRRMWRKTKDDRRNENDDKQEETKDRTAEINETGARVASAMQEKSATPTTPSWRGLERG